MTDDPDLPKLCGAKSQPDGDHTCAEELVTFPGSDRADHLGLHRCRCGQEFGGAGHHMRRRDLSDAELHAQTGLRLTAAEERISELELLVGKLWEDRPL